MPKTPIRDRLKESLILSEKNHVKEALFHYLKEHDPGVVNTTFESLPFDALLTYLKKQSEVWDTMDLSLFVTSHKIIKDAYTTVRNQF